MPLCIWPVFLVSWRPGSDFDGEDGEQCAYTGEQLSPVGAGDWDGSTAVGEWKATQSIPAKSGLFPAVLMLCSIPQNPAKQVDLRCLLDCASRSSPWYTSHIFSSLHSLPTEPLYSLQGIPSLPWCLCFVNIYRLLSWSILPQPSLSQATCTLLF